MNASHINNFIGHPLLETDCVNRRLPVLDYGEKCCVQQTLLLQMITQVNVTNIEHKCAKWQTARNKFINKIFRKIGYSLNSK